MPRPRANRRVACFVLAALGAGGAWAYRSISARRPAMANVRKAVVRRTDLFETLRAGGRVESERKTLIECELENLQISSEGRRFGVGGISTILDLIPEGTLARRGDVLCRLDASEYEEFVGEQRIKVEQVTADRKRAELDVRAAEMALEEYRDGLLPFEKEALRGQVVLAESELRRQTDRAEWAGRMVRVGYVTPASYVAELHGLLRARVSRERARTALWNLERFGGPIALRELQTRVLGLRSNLAFQELRLRREEQRLAKFRRQVELCTIRAPHDGFVIYANEPDGDPRVEVGARVRQKMDLFYLPDLARMEVLATLHESIIRRVAPGMRAEVRVEAFPTQPVEGHVVAVAPLPSVNRNPMQGNEIKNFIGRIQLHGAPAGLRPGMTAEVEIITGLRPGALVIPSEAVAIEDGREVCYVAHDDGAERRHVTLGRSTRDRLEVTEGLEEGEQVVLEPRSLDRAPGEGPDGASPIATQ